jgi:hypothetical protein
MKHLLCLIVLGCAAWPVRAGDLPKVHLSPKEIEEGWILLFDGETTFGWRIDGQSKVENGQLVLGGDKHTTASPKTLFGRECLIRLDSRAEGNQRPNIFLTSRRHYSRKGSPATKDFYVNSVLPKEWQEYTAEAKYNAGQAQIGLQISTGGQPTTTGTIVTSDPSTTSLRIDVPAGSKVFIRNIKVKPLGSQSLFNGKDLSGWKELPGQKSKFSVTKEGWLNVKNGKGDLQSTSQWADFILQLECISNGDFLNSGIFFRCQPDKYQQGYEAQIHNRFTKEGKIYEIADYDSKTHELVGKRKEKYEAVDYGTGAIYRRIPARKQMAKDREWFGMTVIAEGRHIAVWVNGVQVTDWTDNRAANDNGRNGYRAESGPISIQGHDPTTDLSFRNIRIAELPKAK